MVSAASSTVVASVSVSYTHLELLFDVNSAYFHNHGGYEYAKQFYADAYKAAVEIVGGEQYILLSLIHI